MEKKYIKKDNVILRNIPPHYVLVDITVNIQNENFLIQLDETGKIIWELLDQFQEAPAIADALYQMIKEEDETGLYEILGDVREFLDQLDDLNYVNDDGCRTHRNENAAAFDTLFLDYYRENIWERQRVPVAATVELTAHCNFRCSHCYMGSLRDTKEELTTEQWKWIFDLLAEKGVLFLNITGGESLQRGDFGELYQYAKRKGFLISLFSNASMISNEMIEMFVKYPPDKIGVSVYGASEETYQKFTGAKGYFEKVIANIRKIRANGINIVTKTVINKVNVHEFNEIAALMTDADLEWRYKYNIYPRIDNNISNLNLMISPYQMMCIELQSEADMRFGKKIAGLENGWKATFEAGRFVPLFRCTIGCTEAKINFKGDMFACLNYVQRCGNLLTDSFDDIWASFADIMLRAATPRNRCVTCSAIYYCNICPADQETGFGDPESINEKMCKFAMAKKLHYVDGLNLDEISAILKLEEEE